jgi:hypothetical protein
MYSNIYSNWKNIQILRLSIHWWNYIRTLRTTNYNVYWTIYFIGD